MINKKTLSSPCLFYFLQGAIVKECRESFWTTSIFQKWKIEKRWLRRASIFFVYVAPLWKSVLIRFD